MRTIRTVFFIFTLAFLFSSCQDYLDKTPEAEVTDQDVFGTYRSFQGFLDPNYAELIEFCAHASNSPWTMFFGGESMTYYTDWSVRYNRGEFWNIIGPHNLSYYWALSKTTGYGTDGAPTAPNGIWAGGWRGIRRSNETLKNLHLLTDATDEERDLLKGQALFFRAFFHGEIIKSFGGMMYVDTLFSPSDEMKLPRLTYHESVEKIVADLDRAIPLLPVDWDLTGPGSERIGANTGRITRAAALAYKQQALLFAGSPLMNGFSGNAFEYNIDYLKRSAAAGWEVLKMAEVDGIYGLNDWADYSRNFHNSNDGTVVYSKETILARTNYKIASNIGGISKSNDFYICMLRTYIPVYMGGANVYHHCGNQLFMDKFEMSDGTKYRVEYDSDDTKRWVNRDPRFDYTYAVDREKLGNHVKSVNHGYIGSGKEARPENGHNGHAMITKFLCWGMNKKFDKQFKLYRASTPILRLADVYLMYAEAVTGAYGADGKAPGATLTAVDAVNRVRTRATMPETSVAIAAANGYENFMDLIWNERAVELAYEQKHWYDLRRWYIAHLPENKDLVDLEFDKDWTYFNRKVYMTRVFDNPKHYWMPIYRDQVLLYEGFHQNPGW